MADFVGAIDQGTTSTRFMIFDHSGNVKGIHQLEHEQILPQAGWVEHNPVEIWERTTATWLLWNLTGGRDGGSHVTDPTNASRTMLMNLETLDWDDELLGFFGIPRSMLPEIKPSSCPESYGTTMLRGPLGGEVMITGDLGDQ